MDITTKLGLVLGALLLLLIAFGIWKLFASMFKYFLIGVAVLALGVGMTIYRFLPPAKNPAIGQHAYLKENGKYLGVVEGQGEDTQRGPVWVIRLPGGYPKMYGKSRVELKEKYEPGKAQEEPSPSPTTPEPGKKGKKGK